MALNLGVLDERELKPKITVFGVGGAGGNAVNNMIANNLEGADFVIANTDAQAIEGSSAPRRIQLGNEVTQGLGAGMRPEVGREAAEETIDEIIDHLSGANMCFITAGMGGGTGTGAAPVIAKAARELGVLTVGVVTKPFSFEGGRRGALAEQGIEELQQYVDTLIVIPHQNLFRIATENTTIMDAFKLADDVLYQGVKGVTDLMVMPGLINLDFADVRTVMGEMGKAMMGTGEAEGDTRAVDAAEKAIANPLLDDVSLQGARGVLINITGGYDLKLFEVDEAANRIKQEVDPEANIIVGSCFDTTMEGQMRVSVVATGIDADAAQKAIDDAPEVAAPVSAVRRAIPRPAVNPDSGELRPGARHAVRRAAIQRPAAAASKVASSPMQIEDDFDIDEQSVASTEEAVEVDAVATEQLATGTDGPSFPVSKMQAAGEAIPTVIDPNVAETTASAATATPAAPAKRGLSALGGMSLIRKVADSFHVGGDSAKKQPYSDRRLDKDDDDDDNLQIPAFLRRQAN